MRSVSRRVPSGKAHSFGIFVFPSRRFCHFRAAFIPICSEGGLLALGRFNFRRSKHHRCFSYSAACLAAPICGITCVCGSLSSNSRVSASRAICLTKGGGAKVPTCGLLREGRGLRPRLIGMPSALAP